ncbi:MAG: LysR family transcriptional regulator [Candidatus Bathyarchaeia archaeon]
MLVIYPKVKLWFVDENGESVFGEGLAMLLEAVEKYGSLSLASDYLGMSYRYALHRVSLAEKRLGFEIVRRRRGGVLGGSSELTPEGKELLLRFKKIERELEKILEVYKKV